MTTVILDDLVNLGAPSYNEMRVRRGRIVRSSAHDWKSCIPQGIEGSNPSLSAILRQVVPTQGRLVAFLSG
jgi:hypothetical protein